jgi:adenylate cyclase
LSDAPDNSLQLAKQYAQRAVEKDPNEPLAHCVTGLAASFEKDLDRAKSEIDIALSLNPNLALAHNLLGTSLIYSGEPLEAIPAIEQAMRLDLGSVRNLSTSSVGHTCLPASTKRRRQRILLVPRTDFSRVILASALGHLGEVDGARRIWGELKKINPKYSFNEHIARQPLRPEDAERVASGLAKAGLLS